MRILVLGGTRFLGRAMVEAALARGHEVTLFNRGQSAPDLYPTLDRRVGDRDGGLEPLRDGEWDVVLDPSGYAAGIVEQSTRLLASRARHYVFISSISVYDSDGLESGPDEMAATFEPDWESEEVTNESYGPMKVACEQVVSRAYAEHALIVRAGLLVGPHDPTGRFSYWPARFAEGGEVLLPRGPALPIQCIDVRDIATWIILAAETGVSGPVNVTAPPGTQTMGDLAAACETAAGRSARKTYVDEAFLLKHGVAPWTDLPLWVTDGYRYLRTVPVDRALATGLTVRSLDETARDTLRWLQTRGTAATGTLGAGLSRAREAELLALWAHHEAE